LHYSITNSILKDVLVCLPEMEEQQRISNYLDEQTKKIDAAIELQQKQIEMLKEYRASLIDSVVTGKIFIGERNA
jgi:type I restriction enzyme S subunit